MTSLECAFKKPEASNITRANDGLQHYILHCDKPGCGINPARELAASPNIRRDLEAHVSRLNTSIAAHERFICLNTINPRTS